MSNYTQQRFHLETVWGQTRDDPLALPQNFSWLGDCIYIASGIDASSMCVFQIQFDFHYSYLKYLINLFNSYRKPTTADLLSDCMFPLLDYTAYPLNAIFLTHARLNYTQ